jgi:hypothetical protein
LIFEVTDGRILPLPNQKSKINNRKSAIHGRSAAEKTNRVRFTVQKSAVQSADAV